MFGVMVSMVMMGDSKLQLWNQKLSSDFGF